MNTQVSFHQNKPQNPAAGDAYYCTTTGNLYFYSGHNWLTIPEEGGTPYSNLPSWIVMV